MSTAAAIKSCLESLGIHNATGHSGLHDGKNFIPTHGAPLTIACPSNGLAIGSVNQCDVAGYEKVMEVSVNAWKTWREVPAPKRGEVIRQLGDELRRLKEPLAQLVSLEAGKVTSEGLGEVQEMIDICDFAVGLSRQLYGLSMHSERPNHRMYEQWHPLGPLGLITAFNFPVAVWAWNAAIAGVCGDTVVWKPSSKTPFTALATQIIAARVAERNGFPGIFTLVIGRGADVGEVMLHDKRIPLISATGSTRMGKRIAVVVGERFGRTILELGGNNAIIVMNDANLDLAVRAVAFGAVGTAGQRCTTTRRLILQRGISDTMIERLTKVYGQVKIGDPLENGTLMGPLIDQAAVNDMMHALERAKKEGAKILYGGGKIDRPGNYVEPTLVLAPKEGLPVAKDETFAPILYVFVVDTLEEAIHLQNDVPQGLSSSIFTTSIMNSENFLSAAGSDCGIANVNIGTSGAEIGGAFGGEKETGGGRESGSDSWKQYMRRQTSTQNWGTTLPLAQGVKFDI